MSSSNQAGLQALPPDAPFNPTFDSLTAVRCLGGSQFSSEVLLMSTQMFRNIVIVLALTSVAFATSACPEKKGPAEKAGEKIDNAVDKAKDAVK